MRNYVWVFAFLALSAGSVLAARGHGHGGGGGNKNGPVGEKGVFDLYAFSQWWPSTNCAQDNCNREEYAKSIPGFSIHGLWPQYEQQGWPQWCEPDTSDATVEMMYHLPNDLKADLARYWPDVRKTGGECGNSPGDTYRQNTISSEGFWFCEWKKHGVCSDYKTPEEYFRAIIKFRKSFDLEQILIQNSDGKFVEGTESIDVNDLVQAVEKHFGGEKDHIVFLCSGSNVSEVRICLDKSLNHRTCPSSMFSRKCRGTVSFRHDLDSDDSDDSEELKTEL